MPGRSQTGFGVVGVVFGVMFLAVIAFVGYKAVQMNRSPGPSTNTVEAAQPLEAPATISSHDDLIQAGKVLDNSETTVNNSLDSSLLDARLEDLL